jgi:transposase
MVGRGIFVIKVRETIDSGSASAGPDSVGYFQRDGHRPQDGAQYIERGLEAPAYGPRMPRATVIDPFAPYLQERVKSYPGLAGSRLFRELRERGYTGGYTAVTDFLRDVRPPASNGFEVRFETPPGEQAQVDFTQFHVVFTDKPVTPRIVWLLHQNLPTVLRSHTAAFEAIGGAPREVLYDRTLAA